MIVYCAGTATDIGKTHVGAATLSALRAAGATVAARKPVQSFDPGEDRLTDAEVLAAATGEPVERVCRRDAWFEVPMAPPMAADVLGRSSPSLAGLVARSRAPGGVDVVWVEGVGGPRSPVAPDGDGVDLGVALGPDLVVLVADAGLGTVNAVRLSVGALAEVGSPVVVALNRFDAAVDLHRRNRAWLADRCGIDVVAAEDLPARLGGR